jgi:hypothetical protein
MSKKAGTEGPFSSGLSGLGENYAERFSIICALSIQHPACRRPDTIQAHFGLAHH